MTQQNLPPTPSGPVTEDELHAWIDGRHAPGTANRVLALEAQDPAAAEQIAVWQKQREQLRMLQRDVLDEPLPPALLAAADAAARARDAAVQWTRRGAIAASVVVAFTAGWLGNGQWHASSTGNGAMLAETQFARQAAIAHVVYQPEVRHPVEVTAAQQDHLVQWLSKRLGHPLKVPVLSTLGYELVGGRLLPGDTGARAQFMFQNTEGKRITLYIGAMQPGKADSQETAFRFLDTGAAPGFYWTDQGFGYAVSGDLPKAALLDLATSVHTQLQMR